MGVSVWIRVVYRVFPGPSCFPGACSEGCHDCLAPPLLRDARAADPFIKTNVSFTLFFLLNRPPMSGEGPQALTLMSTPPADLLVASRHRNTLLAYGGSRLGIGTRRTWLVPFASLFVTAASSMQPKAFMYHFLKDAARTSVVGQEPVGVSGVYLLMARALDDLRCFDARV